MKIVLAIPPAFSLTFSPPLGLGYLASVLEREGHQVKIFDFTKKHTKIEDAGEIILKENPDIIGLSITTQKFVGAKKLIEFLRSKNSSIPIVVGGVHITALPEYSLQELKVDFGIAGEGERSFPELVKRIQKKRNDFESVKGLIYRENTKIKINEPQDIIENLDELPFPAWHLIDPRDYPPNPWQLFYKNFPVAPIITTRGCPYSCIYCAISQKKYRVRNTKLVVDEIEYLINNFNIKEFQVIDDCFNVYREHVQNFCREIINRNLKILWKTPNGVLIKNIDEEILRLMKQAGCYELWLGIESGVERILEKNKIKKVSLQEVYQKVKLVKDYQIDVGGFFIFGLLGDDLTTISTTINFMVNLPLSFIHIAQAVPVPGSELFSEFYIKDKNLSNINWNDFYFFKPFTLTNISPKKIKSLQRIALFKFYMKNLRFLKVIRKLKIQQIFYFIKLAFNYTFKK